MSSNFFLYKIWNSFTTSLQRFYASYKVSSYLQFNFELKVDPRLCNSKHLKEILKTWKKAAKNIWQPCSLKVVLKCILMVFLASTWSLRKNFYMNFKYLTTFFFKCFLLKISISSYFVIILVFTYLITINSSLYSFDLINFLFYLFIF